LDQSYFNYATGLKMIKVQKWEELFGFKNREADSDLEQFHCNMALAIQIVTEEIVIKMAKEAKRITGSDYLCMAGGVALNCVANGKLLKENIFKEIYIQPASGDAGGSLGAALAISTMYYNEPRIITNGEDQMFGTYLGPDFSEKEIVLMNRKTNAISKKYENFDELTKFIANKIAEGNVVGWFQGRMEFGPRSLGNRSILGDARNLDMQKKLNLKIKYREGFRPFAPSVLMEDVEHFFDLNTASPYMLLVANINDALREKLPDNYHNLSLWERLYFKRSSIQSVTHLDYSARVQTVHKNTNPRYWSLINSFKELTGYGIVVNTSFNVRGEPIVCSPLDAFKCFMSTEMDYLVVGDFVYTKQEQIDANNLEKWRTNFKKD
jgi:carbamoyltransferase